MSDEEAERRAWFEAYVERCESGVVRPPAVWVRYSCPCCRYPTLSERGGYEICPLCNWEDDGQDDPRADEVWGGPNGRYSLAEARRNFEKYLVMFDPARTNKRIGGRDSSHEVKAKRDMVTAFNAMPSAPDEPSLELLWHAVERAEAVLNSELSRKVAAYEAKRKGKRSV